MREFYLDHPALQRLYGRATWVRAVAAARSGHHYPALVHYCDAARRIVTNQEGNREPRERGVRRMAAYVRQVHGGTLPATPATNRLTRAFLASPQAAALRRESAAWPPAQRCRMNVNVLMLKAPRPGERGVLIVKYSQYFERFLALFQLAPLFERYTVVLEPSWTPYPDTYWGLFAAQRASVVCLCITDQSTAALAASGLGLEALHLGPQEWVNDSIFRPLGLAKEFDVVMVASFSITKRHALLFRAMRQMRPRRLRVALVGTAWERSQEDFEAEMRAFGVREDCTLFRGLSPEGVNEVLNRSRVAMLFTRVEGGPKVVMEALAADVPVLLYRHLVGPLSNVTPETGRLADEKDLAQVLPEIIAAADCFHPRAWFEQHSGYRRSTAILNACLRAAAERRGEPWTADIVPKCNRPHLAYVDEAHERTFAPAWKELERLLVPLGAETGNWSTGNAQPTPETGS